MKTEDLFQKLKSDNPNWTDEQIWTHISVIQSADDTISRGGNDISVTEELLRLILEKAKIWLKTRLPEIFRKVVNFFDELIENLPNWAKKGMRFISKAIILYFGGDETIYE